MFKSRDLQYSLIIIIIIKWVLINKVWKNNNKNNKNFFSFQIKNQKKKRQKEQKKVIKNEGRREGILSSFSFFLFGCSIHANHNCVISFVRLQCQLLFWFQLLRLQLFNLGREYSFGCGRRINTTCLKIQIIIVYDLSLSELYYMTAYFN